MSEMVESQRWPQISIVTPNYNQAPYLEQTILSVLSQGYPQLEYIVIDDGSTDNSLEIIHKYSDCLAYSTTRPNKGQYATINEGFARSTGEIMAWLNSDDMYLPGAFSVVAEIFSAHPDVEWLTTTLPVGWNEQGQAVAVADLQGFNRSSFFRGANLPAGRRYTRGCIQQESTFWRRSLWERAGGRLETSVTLAADFELWARFYQHGELYGVNALLGGFRFRKGQNTDRYFRQYVEEAESALRRHGGRPYGRIQAAFRTRIASRIQPVLRHVPFMRALQLLVPAKIWQHSGRGGSWVLTDRIIV